VTSRYYGASEELLAKYAWYLKNSQDRSWPVGSLKPNELGLFDMLGNVWQWCHDAHANYEVPGGGGVIEDVADGAVAADKIGRVLRGGSFSYPPSYVRSAYRTWNLPVSRNNLNGLRVARTYH
jgi:formylglycine-generating enzyme required for sulfatase activity